MMNRLMKKLAVVLTVTTMAIAGGAAASANDGMGIDSMAYTAVAENHYNVTLGQYGANVRMKPAMDGKIITTLDAGTVIEVCGNVYQNGKPSEWVQVFVTDPTYGGITVGYVNECTFANHSGAAGTNEESTFQEYMDNHYAAEAENESHMKGCYATVTVDSSYLALRSAPTYAAENEIEQLCNGELVQIVGDTCGSYIYVCSNSGTYGWVNAGYLY